jgi:hypothetical protein
VYRKDIETAGVTEAPLEVDAGKIHNSVVYSFTFIWAPYRLDTFKMSKLESNQRMPRNSKTSSPSIQNVDESQPLLKNIITVDGPSRKDIIIGFLLFLALGIAPQLLQNAIFSEVGHTRYSFLTIC